MSQAFVFLTSAAMTCGLQWTACLVSFAMQTEVFYDILGGANAIVLAAWSAWDNFNAWKDDSHKLASTAVYVASRSWLLLFLAWRAHDRKGDTRFDACRDTSGRFKLGRFLLFWTVQGMWVFIVAMPMMFVNSSTKPKTDVSMADWVMISGFALGVVIEIMSDIQKALWVSNGRKGTFCRVGLWSISRHPNYFGEILQWWCSWGFAYSSGSGFMDALWWVCIISPAFTMQVLLNMPPTGVTNAEGKNLKRYYDQVPEEYARYRECTSVLIPFVGYKYVPTCLKRTIFFDFEKYEYHPNGSKKD